MKDHLTILPDCAANYMGAWCYEPDALLRLHDAFRAGTLKLELDPKIVAAHHNTVGSQARHGVVRVTAQGDDPADGEIPTLYQLDTDSGVAVMRADGPLMKSWPKSGGTSTVHLRRAARTAVGDERVEVVVLMISSPGGSSLGLDQLGSDLADLNAAKPLLVHTEDVMASAAVWIGTQAGRVYADASAQIGAVGTYLVLYDTSGQFEQEGIKAILISSGGVKGQGADGVPISQEAIDHETELVDAVNTMLVDAVARGRGATMSRAAVETINAEGKMYRASEALKMGLIDGVQRADATIEMATSLAAERREARRRTTEAGSRVATARVRAAGS